MSPAAARPVEERFWDKVDTSAGLFGCWPWIGAQTNGYGIVHRADGNVRATHVALAIAGRPLEPGQLACHTCDNPSCVNPAHLFGGTSADNSADMARKGRQRGVPPLGVRHHSAKLDEDRVRELRRLASEERLPARVLADRFGINESSVRKVIDRQSWRGVR